MPKKYKLITPCAEYPIGTEARQENSNRGYYEIFLPDDDSWHNVAHPIQVEGNPVWELIPEEPEKKIVERVRAERSTKYFLVKPLSKVERDTLEDTVQHKSGNYFLDEEVCKRACRRASIMFTLMNIAETIEEGSTEMKGGYMLVSNDGNPYITHSYITYVVSMRLATFSTKELAQLFLDSAGQDALDWYGAVK